MPRRGGGGGSGRGGARAGAGGGARPPQSREKTISKAMSFVLRHGAEKEGLKMDENGYANVAELVCFIVCVFLPFSILLMRKVIFKRDFWWCFDYEKNVGGKEAAYLLTIFLPDLSLNSSQDSGDFSYLSVFHITSGKEKLSWSST